MWCGHLTKPEFWLTFNDFFFQFKESNFGKDRDIIVRVS